MYKSIVNKKKNKLDIIVLLVKSWKYESLKF